MRKSFLVPLVLLIVGSTACWATAEEPDVVLADFEGENYGDWQVTGSAFGGAPARRDGLLAAHNVSGYEGDGAVHTVPQNDGEQGTLTSPEFTITHPYLNFLIGGGNHYGKTSVNLIVDGNVVRSDTGTDREELLWLTWDVSEFDGQEARIEIVDESTEGWGHINVDSISLSSEPKIRMFPNSHINQAMAVLAHDFERRGEDSWYPTYHYHPPSGWMNDVNGAFYKDGYYHTFYQLNAFHGNFGTTIGWGHARSRDLVNWERMPLAVWPRQDLDERSCWSGGMQFAADGTPVLFYTSVPLPGTADAFVQSAAVPVDEDMAIWDWHPDNPIIE